MRKERREGGGGQRDSIVRGQFLRQRRQWDTRETEELTSTKLRLDKQKFHVALELDSERRTGNVSDKSISRSEPANVDSAINAPVHCGALNRALERQPSFGRDLKERKRCRRMEWNIAEAYLVRRIYLLHSLRATSNSRRIWFGEYCSVWWSLSAEPIGRTYGSAGVLIGQETGMGTWRGALNGGLEAREWCELRRTVFSRIEADLAPR
ncbi:hypothetical protein DFH09DRAFT_1083897 [Mycena vulgaris]|nr:hypothetical protein DFH09DRAFT_1083897 [Mycena vulgaris]